MSQHNLSQDKKVNCVVLAEGSSLVLTGFAGAVNAIEDLLVLLVVKVPVV